MSLTIDPADTTTTPVLPIQPVGEEVLVWTKPGCVQCNATERALTEKGIEHRMVTITDHPDAIEVLRSANFLQMPFVQHGDNIWTDSRPDKIDEIAKAIA